MSTTYPARSVLPHPASDPDETFLHELVEPRREDNEDQDAAVVRDENDDRAARALQGVTAYAQLTYFGAGEGLTTVMGDLLGDLRHACDALGLNWENVTTHGRAHYDEELRGCI